MAEKRTCEQLEQRIIELEETEQKAKHAIGILEKKEVKFIESEAAFKLQQKINPVPTFVWQKINDNFDLVDFNDAAIALTENKIIDLKGKTLKEIHNHTPDIIDDIYKCFEERSNFCKELEYQYQTIDKRRFLAVKYSFSPPDIVIAYTEDITERKEYLEALRKTKGELELRVEKRTKELSKANEILSLEIYEHKKTEDALKESEKKHRLFFENAPLGSIHYNNDGIITAVNSAMSETFGSSSEKLVGLDINDIPDKTFSKEVIKSLNGETGHYKGEYTSHTGGKKSYIKAHWIPIKKDGSNISCVGLVEDITERIQTHKEKEELKIKLQQSKKMEAIGRLAGGIAHDFNNILYPVVGHAEILLEDMNESNPYRDNINGIYRSALRGRDLIKQILTFSRHEPAELKLIKIAPIVNEALKLLIPAIPKSIEIINSVRDNSGSVLGEPTQIHQIIMNLTTNAYHAMEEKGGELRINLTESSFDENDLLDINIKPGNFICLTVADTGVGMTENIIENIFDPFFTTKEKDKGTGMGLSVVHGIVEQMEGFIRIKSELYKGAEFKVYLPVVKDNNQMEKTQNSNEILFGDEKILLVDDEEGIITIEKEILKRLGYNVTTRTNSIEALELFRSNPDSFDLVITDMAMPYMSGDEFSAEIIKIRPNIPIIICTGFSDAMSKEKAESQGIKGFLQKPIVMLDLSRKIREVLD